MTDRIKRCRELDEAAADGPWEADSVTDVVICQHKEEIICDVFDSSALSLITEYRTLCPQLADDLEVALEALEVIATDKNCFEDAPEPEDWPHNVAQATLDKIRGKV